MPIPSFVGVQPNFNVAVDNEVYLVVDINDHIGDSPCLLERRSLSLRKRFLRAYL